MKIEIEDDSPIAIAILIALVFVFALYLIQKNSKEVIDLKQQLWKATNTVERG